jgi:hypothetical protein
MTIAPSRCRSRLAAAEADLADVLAAAASNAEYTSMTVDSFEKLQARYLDLLL